MHISNNFFLRGRDLLLEKERAARTALEQENAARAKQAALEQERAARAKQAGQGVDKVILMIVESAWPGCSGRLLK